MTLNGDAYILQSQVTESDVVSTGTSRDFYGIYVAVITYGGGEKPTGIAYGFR